ncbi:UvrD-like helicase C-terminal domain-containing protein [Sediminibacterium ginsengisoli]|uniref:DNA 3'-5' helicase n=1 Tax=Sediminibacterium ginsengisoli TaxID=413434 RepID=A0A1T4QB27_9BACT|nr:UvrD-like helicase C-terminal domain-containing protein [Sediminibacterium ginsengisoli]
MIDEAQDMNADEYALINTLIEHNEDMRVIAVGDDDQNIYTFRGADSAYLEDFIKKREAKKYELIENYRSKKNLVDFANHFVSGIGHRLKELPIQANKKPNGIIDLVLYQSKNLVTPIVKAITASATHGSVCVLTRFNEEASQITGLLLNQGLSAKLIQHQDGFNLYNLAEIRFFINALKLEPDTFLISEDTWKDAERSLIQTYKHSPKLELCQSIIRDFEAANPKKKYKSDLEIFIRESKIEDFAHEAGGSILVSTIHKAKGKEFDHVYLLLDGMNISTDEDKRQLYVGITRAKERLSIHTNGSYFNDIRVANLNRTIDQTIYKQPDLLVMQTTLKSVILSYFSRTQHIVKGLMSGMSLLITAEGCNDRNENAVLRFSQQCRNEIEQFRQKGYQLKQAKVNFIVYWKDDTTGTEYQTVLPELYFERNHR